jgi:hypothetical protein
MELSLAGLVGAVLGTMLSAALYGPLIDIIERGLRRNGALPEDRTSLANEIALLRRGILAADMLLCAGLGYWIGLKLGG